jgi:hypothetical protein
VAGVGSRPIGSRYQHYTQILLAWLESSIPNRQYSKAGQSASLSFLTVEVGEAGSLRMLHNGKPGIGPGSPIEAERRTSLWSKCW